MTSTRHALTTTALAAALVASAAACDNGTDAPHSSPRQPAPTTSQAPTGQSTGEDTSSPSTEQLAPPAQGAADAYRRFSAEYAAHTMTPASVSDRQATPALRQWLAHERAPGVQRVAARGSRIVYTSRIVSITEGYHRSAAPGQPELQALHVCAVVNSRIIDRSGRDVTVDPQNRPTRPSTTARSYTVVHARMGGRWLVAAGVPLDDDPRMPTC